MTEGTGIIRVAGCKGETVTTEHKLRTPAQDEFLFAWLRGPLEERTVQEIAESFHFSTVLQRRLHGTPDRSHVFVSAKALMATVLDIEGWVHRPRAVPLHLILGPRYLLAVSFPGDEAALEDVWESREDLLPLGADTLIYGLLDPLLDHYEGITRSLSERADTVDELVIQHAPNLYEDIHDLRREVRWVKGQFAPQLEAITLLSEHRFKGEGEGPRPYAHELSHRTERLLDELERVKESASGAVDAYASVVSNSMNRVMKFLTILSTVFLPGTFIASIFGMNFKIPELHWSFGYWWALALMVALGLGFFFYMDIRGWFQV